jgi:hypothetical protein
VLAYGFTKNRKFGGKNWPKLRISWSWPPYCESVIYNGPVFEFLRVFKKSHFLSKSMGVSIRFYRKSHVWGENWPKLRISWSWPPYCESFIYKGPVFEFLWVFKKLNFCSLPYLNFYGFWKISHFWTKSISVSLRFYRKSQVWGQKLTEAPYFLVVTPVLRIGYL